MNFLKQLFCTHKYEYLQVVYFAYERYLKLICNKCCKIKTKNLGWCRRDYFENEIADNKIKEMYDKTI